MLVAAEQIERELELVLVGRESEQGLFYLDRRLQSGIAKLAEEMESELEVAGADAMFDSMLIDARARLDPRLGHELDNDSRILVAGDDGLGCLSACRRR